MRINRETFLTTLQSVSPGLTLREVTDQSTCLIFQTGRVITFDAEVRCDAPSGLDEDVYGAVRGKRLIDLLSKLPDESVDVDFVDGEITIKGKGRGAELRLEAEVLSPHTVVSLPDEWVDLPGDFLEALDLVGSCASGDEGNFALTCVHFAETHIEACDAQQLIRYEITSGVGEFLAQQKSLKHVAALGMTKIAVGEAWMHFANPSGLMLSCRRYMDEFPCLDGMMEATGTPVALPGNLSEVIDRAKDFAGSVVQEARLSISLVQGKMRVIAQDSLARFWEFQTINYDGPNISFRISPRVLAEVSARYRECVVSPSRLKVDGGKFIYISALEPGE